MWNFSAGHPHDGVAIANMTFQSSRAPGDNSKLTYRSGLMKFPEFGHIISLCNYIGQPISTSRTGPFVRCKAQPNPRQKYIQSSFASAVRTYFSTFKHQIHLTSKSFRFPVSTCTLFSPPASPCSLHCLIPFCPE